MYIIRSETFIEIDSLISDIYGPLTASPNFSLKGIGAGQV